MVLSNMEISCGVLLKNSPRENEDIERWPETSAIQEKKHVDLRWWGLIH
jgi:hypothetical protein